MKTVLANIWLMFTGKYCFAVYSNIYFTNLLLFASMLLDVAPQEGGMFKQLDHTDDENIRKDVGEYNNHFTRPGDDEHTIFTQPYIGSQGLGIHRTNISFVFSIYFVLNKKNSTGTFINGRLSYTCS